MEWTRRSEDGEEAEGRLTVCSCERKGACSSAERVEAGCVSDPILPSHAPTFWNANACAF